MLEKLREECGVFGIFDPNGETDVVSSVYLGLFGLQHRGQEACGIAVSDDGVISGYKDTGLVGDVFTSEVLRALGGGQIAIGHCRYAGGSESHRSGAQPLVIQHVKGGMALAHNGCLTNAGELREELELRGAIFHTTSDSEVIAYTITGERITAPSIQEAVSRVMDSIKGAYSLVVMSPKKLIAARDPLGFRPLCIGTLGSCYVVASESCALDSIGATFLRDVLPGEIITISERGLESDTRHCQEKSALCVFEFVYFARSDSVIDGSSVHLARQRAGAFLALEHPVQADVVVGVPDSGIDAALGFARQSGIPYGIGFIKNRYIGRTFIQPGQGNREQAVRIKLNTLAATVAGKRVVLVDDSIVRGTTSARIVRLLREAGATEVHMRVSAPPFLYPCYFGTDIDTQDKLIAHNHTINEIAAIAGVDSLGYMRVESVVQIAENTKLGFCTGCFTGEYPCDIPTGRYRSKYSRKLSDTEE